jgi:hypothetical protein
MGAETAPGAAGDGGVRRRWPRPGRFDPAAAGAVALALAGTLATRSISLDDLDSVNFALALDDFDVAAHQPHPPGFPLYVALGRLLRPVISDPVACLTTLGAVLGAAGLAFLYLLVRRIGGPKTALLALVFTALTPLYWLDSVMALADVPALAFSLAACLALLGGSDRPASRSLPGGAFLVGLAAGVRLHTAALLLPIVVVAASRRGVPSSGRRRATLALAAGVLVWLVPMLAASGVGDYRSATAVQFLARVGQPAVSILGTPWTPGFLARRAAGFVRSFVLGGLGVDPASPGASGVAVLACLSGLVLLGARALSPHDWRVRALSRGLLAYLACVFVLLPPLNARYLLPLVPVVASLAARGVARLRPPALAVCAAVLAAGLLAARTLPLAWIVHTQPAPPVALASALDGGELAGLPVVADEMTIRHLVHLRVSGEVVRARDCARVRALLDGGSVVLATFADAACPDVRAERLRVFARDPRVHAKHSRVELYRLSRP